MSGETGPYLDRGGIPLREAALLAAARAAAEKWGPKPLYTCRSCGRSSGHKPSCVYAALAAAIAAYPKEEE